MNNENDIEVGGAIQHWPALQGWRWLVAGFGLFKQAAGIWVGMLVLWFALGALVAVLPFGGLVSSLFSPVVTAGFLIACQALERGEKLQFGYLFAGFRSERAGALVGLGFASLLLYALVILVFAVLIGFSGLEGALLEPERADPFLLILVLALLMLGLLPVVMALWFATARVALDGLSVRSALSSSLLACWRNLGALTIYGLWMLLLGLLALLPLGLGLLILLPLGLLANYCAWKDIFHAQGQQAVTPSLID